jgi:nitrogen fixation protein NifQ
MTYNSPSELRLMPAVADSEVVHIATSPKPDAGGTLPEDEGFDHLIVSGMLAKALGERDRVGGALARRLGVGGIPLAVLLWTHIPGHPVLAPEDYVAADESEEQTWVRDLLERHLTVDNELSRWIAAIVARRSMEADHLWEDLGLPDRSALSKLMHRHFAPLASRNEGASMRWKRFLYRQLCEEEGMSHCTSPTCSSCIDVDKCFEPQSTEALLARTKHAPA